MTRCSRRASAVTLDIGGRLPPPSGLETRNACRDSPEGGADLGTLPAPAPGAGSGLDDRLPPRLAPPGADASELGWCGASSVWRALRPGFVSLDGDRDLRFPSARRTDPNVRASELSTRPHGRALEALAKGRGQEAILQHAPAVRTERRGHGVDPGVERVGRGEHQHRAAAHAAEPAPRDGLGLRRPHAPDGDARLLGQRHELPEDLTSVHGPELT